jgi:hypothetical protein
MFGEIIYKENFTDQDWIYCSSQKVITLEMVYTFSLLPV